MLPMIIWVSFVLPDNLLHQLPGLFIYLHIWYHLFYLIDHLAERDPLLA